MSGNRVDVNIDLGKVGGDAKSEGAGDARVQLRTLELINAARAKAGVPALLMSVQLNQAAQQHCLDMDQRDYLGPLTPEGTPISARTQPLGYQGRVEALVAMGAATPDSVMAEWGQNAGGKAHLIDATYQHVGVAMVGGVWTVILGTPPSSAMKDVRDLRGRVLELVNRERSQAALPVMEMSDALCSAAQEHSADMAKREFFQSVNPEGISVAARAQKLGFPGRAVACLAKGPVSPEEAVTTWLGSSRGNLLHKEICYLGVAVTAGRWTLLLGTKN